MNLSKVRYMRDISENCLNKNFNKNVILGRTTVYTCLNDSYCLRRYYRYIINL